MTSEIIFQNNEIIVNQKVLVFEIHNKWLLLAVYDKKSQDLHSIVNYQFENQEELTVVLEGIQRDYQDSSYVYLSYNSTYSTLIPNDLFDSSLKSAYISFNYTEVPEEEIVNTENIHRFGAVHCYTINKTFSEKIHPFFPQLHVIHQNSIILERIKKEGVYLYLNDGSNMSVFIVNDDKQLILYNQFVYHNPEDVIYYLSSIFKMYFLSHRDTTLNYGGCIEKEDAVYSLLSKYFAILKPMDMKSNVMDNSYKYFGLLNVIKCVL